MSTATTRPPVLLIHGAWHGKWCYERYFTDYLQEQGFDVHAIDLPEHGEKFTSVGNQRWLKVSDYVAAIADYVSTMAVPPVLVGHSMGGFVVQNYLAQQNPAAGGVLLASIPPQGVLRTTLNIARHHPIRFLKTNLTMSLAPLVDGKELVRQNFFSAEITPSDLQTYYEQIHGESYRAFLDMLLFDRPKTENVTAPMLVMGAENDTIFTVDEVKATAAAYQTNAIIFKNMAHDMMLEPGWQQVADHIVTWIDGDLKN